MPIPSPADFRDRTKKHSQVREMLAQMAENVESKDDSTQKQNEAKVYTDQVFLTASKLIDQNQDSISNLSVSLHLLIQALAQVATDSTLDISTITATVASLQSSLNSLTLEHRDAVNAHSDAINIIVSSLNSVVVYINEEIPKLIDSSSAMSAGFDSLILAVTQTLVEINTVVDSLSATSLDIATNKDAISALSTALHSVLSVINELYQSNPDVFDADLKNSKSIIFDQLLMELSKLNGFDPASAGSNKYVESESIVFFPSPSNIIRIDVTTTGNLPTAKGIVINAEIKINVDGQILSNYGTLEVQGSSSANFPKKNWTFCLFSDSARANAIPIKLGHMIAQEELVWKANFVDNTHSRNLACNRLWQAMVDSRQLFPKNEVDDSNMLNSNLTSENYNGLAYAPTGASGHVDGFQAVVYINNAFYGIGSLNIGKKRENYNLAKNNQKHIQVGPEGNWPSSVSFTNMPEHPYDLNTSYGNGTTPYYEVRRPADWGEEAQVSWSRLRAFTALSKDDMQAAGIDNYFNRKNMMDYIILIQVCDLWDHMGKNSLITTWDGLVWSFMPYDLDTCFGLYWTGKYFGENGTTAWRPASNVLIPANYSTGNTGLFSKCRRIYGTAIDERYAQLRKAKIIDAVSITAMCDELLRKFPTALLKAENTKWNTGTTSIYTSVLQTGSVHQIYTWLTEHIAVCDAYFNYTTQ